MPPGLPGGVSRSRLGIAPSLFWSLMVATNVRLHRTSRVASSDLLECVVGSCERETPPDKPIGITSFPTATKGGVESRSEWDPSRRPSQSRSRYKHSGKPLELRRCFAFDRLEDKKSAATLCYSPRQLYPQEERGIQRPNNTTSRRNFSSTNPKSNRFSAVFADQPIFSIVDQFEVASVRNAERSIQAGA